jgi:hypothetical protein
VHQRYASALRKRDELFDRIKAALVGYLLWEELRAQRIWCVLALPAFAGERAP